jgi:hypothetical protein
VTKAVLLFLAAFTLYFLTLSPALDEIDAVQFAMGVRSFDLWHRQSHPPGYPLFIFLGWIGTKVLHIETESSLYCVSALGGGLFVASWFLIIRAQFSEKLAWWIATSLLITPVVWMTATKAVTDTLAAGLLSAELLAAIYFLEHKKRSLIICAALLGAAASGIRPQLSPVVAVILGIPLKKKRLEREDLVLRLCGANRGLSRLAFADVVHPMAIAAKRAIPVFTQNSFMANGGGALTDLPFTSGPAIGVRIISESGSRHTFSAGFRKASASFNHLGCWQQAASLLCIR